MSDISHILSAIDQGDPLATEQLLPLVLRRAPDRVGQVGRTVRLHAPGHRPGPRGVPAAPRRGAAPARNSLGHRRRGRGHAAGFSSSPARHKHSLKAGGGRRRQELPDIELADAGPRLDMLALHEALTRLEQRDQRRAELVKLRFFAGLTIAEAARGKPCLRNRRPTTIGPTPRRLLCVEMERDGDGEP